MFSLFFIVRIVLRHGFFQRRDLFEQFFKFHARQAFQDRRQLADDLRHVPRQLARAAARPAARIDDEPSFPSWKAVH